MASWLAKTGVRATLLLGSLDENHLDLPKCSVIVIGDQLYDRLPRPRVMKSIIDHHDLSSITHIYAYNSGEMLLALHFASHLHRKAKVLAGCYFPWGFLYPKWSWTFSSRPQWERGPFKYLWRMLIAFIFDKCIPDRNKVFTVKPIRDQHEKNFGRSLREARIWFVPLDFSIFKMRERRPIKGRIVSIGRICETKAYNRYMIDIIQDLLAQGMDVHWIVYGHGDLLGELKSIVEIRNLSQRIHFKGIINYQDIPLAVQDAWIFVGTGTAILEAGWCGLVCIPTIEAYPEPMTYGFLHESPGFATGVAFAYPPENQIAEMIKDVYRWTEVEYNRICNLTRAIVGQFDSDTLMPEFVKICESAETIRFGQKERAILIINKLVSRTMKWARLLSRALRA
jgi:glycosyltransferase involved in cell wall biosynthesis